MSAVVAIAESAAMHSLPDIDIFYGITTTTLVVLSSATLAVFQFFSSSIAKKIESGNDRLKEIVGNNGQLSQVCDDLDDSIKFALVTKYDELKNKYTEIKATIDHEIMALFLVIFCAAVSIFLVLFSGVFPEYALTAKSILVINFLSIIIYIIAFISFVIRILLQRKELIAYNKGVDEFLSMYKRAYEFKINPTPNESQ